MRMTNLYAPTLRETPAEAEIASHKLALRAGLMRKNVSGVYTYLPLGWRVIRKVEQIVREEMDRAGGQEILMSALQPAELWQETGRWYDYGPEMFKLTDRAGRQFCLGPTHEEIFTALVRDEVKSYRQLPLLLYQIQTKYRDEIRPRFGLMRARDFIMKDLYSFDRDEAGLDVSYQKMYDAYCRAFHRCGIDYRVVEADVGAMGGSSSHEFMVIADVGEAQLVYCDECGYAGNVERAEAIPAPAGDEDEPFTPREKVPTPNMRTIEELTAALGLPPSKFIKTMIYTADGKVVAALVRGDREVNDVKLKNVLKAIELELAPPEVIERVTGAPVGFAGPIGLSGVDVIVADREVPHVRNAVVGANEADAHIKGVNYGRDYAADIVTDIRTAVAGDKCPKCGAALLSARGIEVGHIFKLGTKYSEALGATFLDEEGKERVMIMGSYGIGITRTVAAIIEKFHDEDGIKWPMPVAPYHVVIVPVSVEDEAQLSAAEKLYNALNELGVETVLDDRDERPGVKFKDADLIGWPLRVTIGPKSLAHGSVEIKVRATGELFTVPLDDAAKWVSDYVRAELAKYVPRGERA